LGVPGSNAGFTGSEDLALAQTWASSKKGRRERALSVVFDEHEYRKLRPDPMRLRCYRTTLLMGNRGQDIAAEIRHLSVSTRATLRYLAAAMGATVGHQSLRRALFI